MGLSLLLLHRYYALVTLFKILDILFIPIHPFSYN